VNVVLQRRKSVKEFTLMVINSSVRRVIGERMKQRAYRGLTEMVLLAEVNRT
jgi:hypothetical protein